MIVNETIFVQGRPVGRLLVNTNSQEIAFQPAKPPSLLPDKQWSSVDEVKAAVTLAYFKPKKDETPGGDTEGFNFLAQDSINQTHQKRL